MRVVNRAGFRKIQIRIDSRLSLEVLTEQVQLTIADDQTFSLF